MSDCASYLHSLMLPFAFHVSALRRASLYLLPATLLHLVPLILRAPLLPPLALAHTMQASTSIPPQASPLAALHLLPFSGRVTSSVPWVPWVSSSLSLVPSLLLTLRLASQLTSLHLAVMLQTSFMQVHTPESSLPLLFARGTALLPPRSARSSALAVELG